MAIVNHDVSFDTDILEEVFSHKEYVATTTTSVLRLALIPTPIDGSSIRGMFFPEKRTHVACFVPTSSAGVSSAGCAMGRFLHIF